jgi:competence protein ComEC
MGVSYVNFSVVRFAVCLAIGTSTGYWVENFELFSTTPATVFVVLVVLVIVLFTSWRWNKKQLEPTPIFGLLVWLLFFFIGFTNYSLRLPKSQKNHFTHHMSSENRLLELKITEELKPDVFNTKYIAEVRAIDNIESQGKILLQLRKDSLKPLLSIDDVVLAFGNIWFVPGPKNPHQFKYASYMKTMGVYGQLQVKQRDLILTKKGKNTIIGFSESIRNHLIKKLKSTALQNNERSILQALVLGQRRDINKSLYNDYAAAGAIHILAVSGLHVGILYFILLFLFKPITYFKYGSLARSVIIIVLLWGFAVLAGVSPSVVRAVTMFSFFTFATAIKRPTNSFNTLFLSFFLLLLLRPNWLFHVGFQLSYLAVFAILWIQPKLYKLYEPKFYLDRLFWGIITVTIAAQLGIVPLSLYYFHQFPGLFFVTNVVILPVLGVLLTGGLLLVILAAFDTLPGFYAEGYNFCISLLNNFISWVAQQDAFLFEDIPFSKVLVVGSYLLLANIVLLWKHYHYRRLLYCLASVSVLIVILIWEQKKARYSEMVIFNKSRNSLIGIKENTQFTLFKTDTISSNISRSYPIKSYKTATSIGSYSEEILPKYFRFQQQSILVLDSLGVYPRCFEVTVVLLTHSPKINLERLIDSLQPKQIIADGSNYRSYVNRWRETCKKKKLPFHHTGTKGAFTFK